MMAVMRQVISEGRAAGISALRAKLGTALHAELRSGNASVERLDSGDIRIVLQAELLLADSGVYRLNAGGRALLDRLVPALSLLESGWCVRVICHSSRQGAGSSRQAFVDAWKQTGWCSAHVVRHFLWKKELSGLHFRAEGRSCAEPLVPHALPQSRDRNRRVEIYIGEFGGCRDEN